MVFNSRVEKKWTVVLQRGLSPVRRRRIWMMVWYMKSNLKKFTRRFIKIVCRFLRYGMLQRCCCGKKWGRRASSERERALVTLLKQRKSRTKFIICSRRGNRALNAFWSSSRNAMPAQSMIIVAVAVKMSSWWTATDVSSLILHQLCSSFLTRIRMRTLNPMTPQEDTKAGWLSPTLPALPCSDNDYSVR